MLAGTTTVGKTVGCVDAVPVMTGVWVPATVVAVRVPATAVAVACVVGDGVWAVAAAPNITMPAAAVANDAIQRLFMTFSPFSTFLAERLRVYVSFASPFASLRVARGKTFLLRYSNDLQVLCAPVWDRHIA